MQTVAYDPGVPKPRPSPDPGGAGRRIAGAIAGLLNDPSAAVMGVGNPMISLSSDVTPLAQKLAARIARLFRETPAAAEASHVAPWLDLHGQPIKSPGPLFRNPDEIIPSAMPPNTGGPLTEPVRPPVRRGTGPIIPTPKGKV